MDITEWKTDSVYKSNITGVSPEGIPIYTTYTTIACRIQYSTKLVKKSTGEDYISNVQILSDEALDIGDKLWLSSTDASSLLEDELKPILFVDKVSSKSQDLTLYKAYL